MRCADVMRRDPVACRETESVQAAAIKMRDSNLGFLPVLGEQGAVIGAITDRDIAVRASASNLDSTKTLVRDVMTREIHFVAPTDSLKEAEEVMARRKIQRVMVMDAEGTLLGVVSLSDLSKADWGWRVARTLTAVGQP